MRWIIATVIVMLAAPAGAEEVLYCVDTDINGFEWEKGSSEGKRTHFMPGRWIVKIVSEEEREIQLTKADSKPERYTCRLATVVQAHSRKEAAKLGSRTILCDQEGDNGMTPWIFYDNTFMRASMSAPPTGRDDSNAYIAYGTCTKF